jgi:hypothetical protein
MFEQAFKNIDDILRKEAGCTTELDYTEQTSWLLFLKYLDALELDKADEAGLQGKNTPSSSTSRTAGKNGPRPRTKAARSTTIKRKPAMTFATSLTPSYFPISTVSSKRPAAPTPSNTKSAKSSAKSKTRFRAATTSARSSTISTSCAFARKPKSTS